MANDDILILLSAYADRELHAADCKAVEARIAACPELRRELDIFGKLDSAVRALPVPSMVNAGVRWRDLDAATAGLASLDKRLNRVILAAPEISNQRFHSVWTAVAARTFAPSEQDVIGMRSSCAFDGDAGGKDSEVSANDRRIWTALDMAAKALPVPHTDGLTARELWHSVAERTTGISAEDRAAFAKLENAAGQIQEPKIEAATFETAWENVSGRTLQGEKHIAVAPVPNPVEGPAPSPVEAPVPSPVEAPKIEVERWGPVWQNISRDIASANVKVGEVASAAPVKPARVESPAPRAVPMAKRGWWRPILAAGLAAAVLFGVLVSSQKREPDLSASAIDVPEELDDRYQVQVNYPDGKGEPVVCVFLKNDVAQNDAGKKNWQWLPD